jgi:hypothetical protein
MTVEQTKVSFFDRPNIAKGIINVGQGIPFGIECVTNPAVGIGGVYGTWGESYDNDSLRSEQRLGTRFRQPKPESSELAFQPPPCPCNLTRAAYPAETR